MLLFLKKLFTPKEVEKKYLLIKELHDYIEKQYTDKGVMDNTGMCSTIIRIFYSDDRPIIQSILRKHKPKNAFHRGEQFSLAFWYKPYDAVPRLKFLKKLMKKYKSLY